MHKLFMTLGAVLFGYGFGGGADALGASFMLSFFISGLGSIIGIVAGWKLARAIG